MAETFAIWKVSRDKELAEMMIMLHKQLSANPDILAEQVCKAESWYCYFQMLFPVGDSYLKKAESDGLTFLNNSEGRKNNTETEKKIKIAAGVCEVRELRDKLENMVDCLKTRISLGQTLIKACGEKLYRGTNV